MKNFIIFNYSSVSVIRMIELRLSQARLVACGRDHKWVQNVNWEPKCNWNDSTKVDLKEPGLEGTNLIHLAQRWNQWWASVNIMKVGIPW